MDKDSDKNSANSEEELPEKELSEMDVKKIMIFRQIGAKIAYYRTLRQMTQAELAKRANLSKGSIGRIERGKYNKGVPISTLLDIAESLRIDLSSLVTFSEEEKSLVGNRQAHALICYNSGEFYYDLYLAILASQIFLFKIQYVIVQCSIGTPIIEFKLVK